MMFDVKSELLAAHAGFRPMREGDLDTILEIERVSQVAPWTRGNFTDSLNAGCSAWTLEVNGEIAGYVVFAVAVGEGHLLNITVAPQWRRHGIARRMLAEMREICRERGAQAVYLEVRVSNETAQALYRSAGYVEFARRKRYYPAPSGREDAVMMLCRL